MTGRKEYKDVLYLIDFGLSKKYKNPKTGEHIKYFNNHRLNGTARFASIHALEGYELSRRDDLESLCYVLVYLLKGSLPWMKLKNKNKFEKYKIILTMKKKMGENILIGDNNNPEFIDFIKYCRGLKFEEEPNYDYLRGLMIKCYNKNNKPFDNMKKSVKLKNDIFEYSLMDNITQNKNIKHKRTCSAKKIKINIFHNKSINIKNLNQITEYNNIKIKENKSFYTKKKKKYYSYYKPKKCQHNFYDNDLIDENMDNNIKFINIKYINNIIIRSIEDKNNNKIINKKKTTFKDNSTASSSNENKKYSLTKLDLIKKGLGIEPKKAQMIKEKEEETSDKNEDEDDNNKKDGCIIL